MSKRGRPVSDLRQSRRLDRGLAAQSRAALRAFCFGTILLNPPRKSRACTRFPSSVCARSVQSKFRENSEGRLSISMRNPTTPVDLEVRPRDSHLATPGSVKLLGSSSKAGGFPFVLMRFSSRRRNPFREIFGPRPAARIEPVTSCHL